MALINNKVSLTNVRQRNYLARDFDGFRTVLLDYARQYYPDRIQDFSEASMGGLLLDMAAYIGDNMSFYLDHLHGELNADTAVETSSIQTILRNSGVKVTGASASIVDIDFYVEVPLLDDGSLRPDPALIPTILDGTSVRSSNGTEFTLLENVQFWDYDASGSVVLASDVAVSNGRRVAGSLVSKILKKSGRATSGSQTTESFAIGDFIPFRRVQLSNPDVTQIINVIDGYGNIYYEVETLTNDVVYKNVLNSAGDNNLVKDSLKVIPAPYRFITEVALGSRTTSMTFGGGSADSINSGIVPDPSEFAIPLPFSQTFSRVAVNPQKLLQTSTLGAATANTTYSVTYRYGGGLSHNVSANSVRNITVLNINFPLNPSPGQQLQVRNSVEASNPSPSAGGDDAPSTDALLALAPATKNAQERIVTREDLLARVYTLPSNFGRVFRALVTSNPDNPLAARLFIISRDANSKLTASPDTLKINLKKYLNAYRMISDAVDIFDASVINLELKFSIVVDPSLNKSIVIQNIITDLKKQFDVTNMQINQPIVISDVISTIFSRSGVIAVDNVKFNNLSNTVANRDYSSTIFDPDLNTRNQIIYPPDGSIFEIRYPDVNIIGKAVSSV